MGIACHCEINNYIFFERKNYFYPDLPKGYQITQDKEPICKNGYITICVNNTTRNIPLFKIHIEEDAGKLIHDQKDTKSLIDYNRAGAPLLEIVTLPAIYSPEEASTFLYEIQKMIRYLEISNGNMEEGSLRCDANISMREKGIKTLGTKVEIKNINSPKFVQKAIQTEIVRQIELIEQKKNIVSETRLYDQKQDTTFSMRTKEESKDYRYFPDPDIPPITLSQNTIDAIRVNMPMLPFQYRDIFKNTYHISDENIDTLTENKECALFTHTMLQENHDAEEVCKWILGPIRNLMKKENKHWKEISVTLLKDLIEMVKKKEISFSTASQHILPDMLRGLSPRKIAIEKQLIENTTTYNLEEIINTLLQNQNEKLQDYKNGKTGLLQFFIGEVMKKTKASIHPQKIHALLLEKLHNNE